MVWFDEYTCSNFKIRKCKATADSHALWRDNYISVSIYSSSALRLLAVRTNSTRQASLWQVHPEKCATDITASLPHATRPIPSKERDVRLVYSEHCFKPILTAENREHPIAGSVCCNEGTAPTLQFLTLNRIALES